MRINPLADPSLLKAYAAGATFIAVLALCVLFSTKRDLKAVCSYYGPGDELYTDSPKTERERVTLICTEVLNLRSTAKNPDD